MSKLLEKIKGYFESDLEDMGEINSLSVNNFKTIYNKKSISKYLPFSVYKTEQNIFINNDGSYSYIVEVAPRVHCDGGTAKIMEEIVNKLPSKVFFQTFYYGSENLAKEIEEFKSEHLSRVDSDDIILNELMESSIQNYAMFLEQKTKDAITEKMQTKAKKIRLIFSINSKKFKKLLNFKKQLHNILGSNNFFPEAHTEEEIFKLIYELFNPDQEVINYPKYDKRRDLNVQMIHPESDFLADDNYLRIGKNKYWINNTIQEISPYYHITEFSDKLGQVLGETINSNQFKSSFIIALTVTRKPNLSKSLTTKNHSAIIQQNWSTSLFRKYASVQEESVEILDRIDAKKEELFEFDMNILVSGNSKSEAIQNNDTIESFWKKNTNGYTKISLAKTRGIHHLSFLSNLPGCMSEDFFYELGAKFSTKFINQLSHLFPLEAEYTGAGRNLPFFTRRGNLAFVDLYKSNSNFNGFVIASSGQGKSVLLNMLAFASYMRGDKVFVLDYDNSFTGVIDAVNGQYLELNAENPISFNPFSILENEKDLNDQKEYLSSFIYLLGSNKNYVESEKQEKLIKTVIQDVLTKLWGTYGNEMEVTHIRDEIKSKYSENDTRLKDFSTQLGLYCKNGLYEKWFSGECEFEITNDFTAVEFKGVENHDDLRNPLIMLLMYHLGKIMFSDDPNKPRVQIILDEVHRFLGRDPRMDDFIDQSYRRARKFAASMIVATQKFSDVFGENGLSKAGDTIVNNSAWNFFLKQKDNGKAIIDSGIFNFSEHDVELVKSLITQKKQYSEILVVSPDNMNSVFRFVLPKYFYYLTTTDAEDKKKINNVMEVNNCSKTVAIQYLVQEEEKLNAVA